MAYLQGFTFEAFVDDPRTVDAVERCMQRITEAAIRLQPQAAEWLPGQDWDAMRGFGNVLRHDYDVVSEQRRHRKGGVGPAMLSPVGVSCKRQFRPTNIRRRNAEAQPYHVWTRTISRSRSRTRS